MKCSTTAWTVKLSLALALSCAALGCGTPTLSTAVLVPAHAEPGWIGFGKGVSVLKGASNAAITQAASSVVIAASSDPDGPSEIQEPDAFWRVRGNMLEFCRWADDGGEDCRFATYEGGIGQFIPTILEPGNLGRGATLVGVDSGQTKSVVQSLAQNETVPVRFDKHQTIWVLAAGLGLGSVFACSVTDTLPTCQSALPLARPMAMFTIENEGEQVSVLWAGVGRGGLAAVGLFGGFSAVESISRCESRAGKTECKPVKE